MLFSPHDLTIGAKTWNTIDEAIRLRDKPLVILSEAAIGSDWVEDEVTKALAWPDLFAAVPGGKRTATPA
jgi:hypothetical protein